MARARTSPPALRLRLYIAGSAPNSVQAIANINAICGEHFEKCHDLEIIDLLTHPLRALADAIIVTPTLLRMLPLPKRRVIGNLSNLAQVLAALRDA